MPARVALLLCISLLAACERPEIFEGRATILAVDGDAVLRRGDARIPLTTAVQPRPGDRIRLAKGATATISPLPGLRLTLSDRAEILFEELRVQKRGDATSGAMRSRRAEFWLFRGKVRVGVAGFREGAETSLLLRMDPGAIEAGRGAIFSVETGPAGAQAVCADGRIRFYKQGLDEMTEIPQRRWKSWTPAGDTVTNLASVRGHPELEEELGASLAAARAAFNMEQGRRGLLPGKPSSP